MNIWNYFLYFALSALACCSFGAFSAWCGRKKTAVASTVIGIVAFLVYILIMWKTLDRPPMRTMGETRLWYSLFLPAVGLAVYLRHSYKWVLGFSTLLSGVFMAVNLMKPEIHTKALMPALQSIWFAPHVVVYMLAYAVLGVAVLLACAKLLRRSTDDGDMIAIDNLVRTGWALLTMGIIFGSMWAKDAWGDYWTWDPKETWALATWLAYLLYLHLRVRKEPSTWLPLALVIVSFALLQVTWWGINYLPAAQGQSIHTYSM